MRTFLFCNPCGRNWISNVPVCPTCLEKYEITPQEVTALLGEDADFDSLEAELKRREEAKDTEFESFHGIFLAAVDASKGRY